jgi:nucleotide-binding universal stress UspA family protein
MGRIVVGVDGSPQAQAALEWAVEEAAFRRASVEAVYVYDYTPAWQEYAYATGGAPAAGYADEETLEPDQLEAVRARIRRDSGSARGRAQALVERVIAALGDTRGVPVEAVVQEDRRPARALLERSRDADMLVLGSRGRGGFAGLALGSVSQQCTHHATCPIVVIRAERRDG